MTSGPVVLMVLEGENAVVRNRDVMGATDPKKAADGTIRKDFATDIEKNTVHGSDSPENAKIEVSYFFPEVQVHAYDWKKKRLSNRLRRRFRSWLPGRVSRRDRRRVRLLVPVPVPGRASSFLEA